MIVNATGWELEPTPWATQAACKGTPTPIWFPAKGKNIRPAQAICADCPVQTECLDYALTWKITFGIWGGLSPIERRHRTPTRRARRTVAAHGTTTRYARGCRCDGCTEAKTLDHQLRAEDAR